MRSPCDKIVMRVLTRQVRVISHDQAARIVRSTCGNETSADSAIGRLLDQGMIDTTSLAVAYPQIGKRLLLWHQHRPAPNYEHTRWLLERRWGDVTPMTVPVYWATAKAERFYGGVAGLLNHSGQLEHDLGSAEVLATAYEAGRRWAQDWVGEDLLKREHPALTRRIGILPDAVTLAAHDRIFKAIEFGGQYSVRRLRRLHEAFERQHLRYEIW